MDNGAVRTTAEAARLSGATDLIADLQSCIDGDGVVNAAGKTHAGLAEIRQQRITLARLLVAAPCSHRGRRLSSWWSTRTSWRLRAASVSRRWCRRIWLIRLGGRRALVSTATASRVYSDDLAAYKTRPLRIQGDSHQGQRLSIAALTICAASLHRASLSDDRLWRTRWPAGELPVVAMIDPQRLQEVAVRQRRSNFPSTWPSAETFTQGNRCDTLCLRKPFRLAVWHLRRVSLCAVGQALSRMETQNDHRVAENAG